MKTILVFVTMAITLAAISVRSEEKLTVFSFDAEPSLTTVTEPYPGQRTPWLKNFFQIPATNGRSFAMELDVNITVFNHYGMLLLGMDNEKGQCLDFRFNKDDSRVNRCHLRAQAAKGLATKIKPFDNIKPGAMKASIVYDAKTRTAEFSLSTVDGKPLFQSGKIKVAGKLNLTRVVVGVTQNDDEVSEISYDADGKSLFCRSYVGVEGEYPYAIEASVDNIAVSTEQPEAAK